MPLVPDSSKRGLFIVYLFKWTLAQLHLLATLRSKKFRQKISQWGNKLDALGCSETKIEGKCNLTFEGGTKKFLDYDLEIDR